MSLLVISSVAVLFLVAGLIRSIDSVFGQSAGRLSPFGIADLLSVTLVQQLAVAVVLSFLAVVVILHTLFVVPIGLVPPVSFPQHCQIPAAIL